MKFNRVVQIGFDLAIAPSITDEQVSNFASQIQNNINEGNELGLACLNGTHDVSDVTECYSMDEINNTYRDTKFIFYSLNIRQSNIENTENFVAEIPVGKSIREYVEEMASQHYGEGEEERDGWYFEDGCVCVQASQHREISKEEYETLKTFL